MKKTPFTVRFFLALACAAAAAGLAACATQTHIVTDGLNVAEIFQRAQDAVSHGDFKAGIKYYSVVPKNFPDDKAHGAWAEYEIAFLYHKMGKNDTALSLLKTLLDEYAQAGDTLPPGPQILAQKLKTRLEAAASPATSGAAAATTPTPSTTATSGK